MLVPKDTPLSIFEMVLPQNVLNTCNKLSPCEGAEFLSTNLRRKTATRLFLRKKEDHSVLVKVTIHLLVEVGHAGSTSTSTSQGAHKACKPVDFEYKSRQPPEEPSLIPVTSGRSQTTGAASASILSSQASKTTSKKEPMTIIQPKNAATKTLAANQVVAEKDITEHMSTKLEEKSVDFPSTGNMEGVTYKIEISDDSDSSECETQSSQLAKPKDMSLSMMASPEDDVYSENKLEIICEGQDNARNLTGQGDNKCRFCGDTQQTRLCLLNHIKQTHSQEESVQSVISDLMAPHMLECKYCGMILGSQRQLLFHCKKFHSKQNALMCFYCKQVTKNEAELKLHLQELHSQSYRHYLCHLCPASFRIQAHLNEHLKHVHSKHPSSRFSCVECDFTCKSQKYLYNHYRRVHNGQQFSCPKCDRKFTVAGNMHRHIHLVHQKGSQHKMFKCHKCGKTFSLKANLKEHINSMHLRKFSFTCDICQDGFRRRKELDAHRQIHLDITTHLKEGRILTFVTSPSSGKAAGEGPSFRFLDKVLAPDTDRKDPEQTMAVTEEVLAPDADRKDPEQTMTATEEVLAPDTDRKDPEQTMTVTEEVPVQALRLALMGDGIVLNDKTPVTVKMADNSTQVFTLHAEDVKDESGSGEVKYVVVAK